MTDEQKPTGPPAGDEPALPGAAPAAPAGSSASAAPAAPADDEEPDTAGEDAAAEDLGAEPGGRPGGPIAPGEEAEHQPAPAEPDAATTEDEPSPAPVGAVVHVPRERPAPVTRPVSPAAALIALLLALFGFTLVVQLRSNSTDQGLASARQEDLVRILSDLENRDTRLQAEITALETTQRQLTSGVAGREAALEEADKRAEELGLLAGTLPARGPGLRIDMTGVKASDVLNAVQELRGAGGEVMQIQGSGTAPVRIVASSYFVDAPEGGISVDAVRMPGPYTIMVIGPAQTMETALNIPGGVVASVEGDGGSVGVERREAVEVAALRKATALQHARPVS